MARIIGKLTALKVDKANRPGMYGDGGGLYLRITEDGAKNWVFRFMLNGRARWMGMGPLHTVNLAEARKRAGEHRLQRHDGIDPIEARRAERSRAQLDAAKAVTFKECAESYIKAHRAGWRNGKHAAQWEATLATYAEPIIGKLSVQAIDTTLVLKVLEPIWTAKPETAGRVRGRIEAVLDWAKVRGFRVGENPARWRGHLSNLLPARARVRAVKHHAALPYPEIGTFMADLRTREGAAAAALEFLILTAARTAEVIGARRSEIDFRARIWTVPAERMKAKREHRVPLSSAAMKVLERANVEGSEFLFGGITAGQGLSNMALLKVLERMNRGDVTVHGFRATLKTWATERSNFSREPVEAALAHVPDDKTEAAYQRGDMLEKRRRLMSAWAEFCGKRAPVGTVVNLRQM